MRIGSLFSGIGGLELGLERSGLGHVVWQVEKDPFCRSVLEKHWPRVARYEDVKDVGADLAAVDLICGGFPCQDVSSAGNGAGLSGSRSGLWFEFARIVGELRPEWVIVENVASGARRWVDTVCSGLGQLGYETLPIPLSAADVGAPHLRRRIFVVAHAERGELRNQPGRFGRTGRERSPESADDGKAGFTTHARAKITQRQRLTGGIWAGDVDPGALWREGPTISPVCGVDDGVPRRVDRLKALGNAVVPQCAEVIGHAVRLLSEQV